MIAAFLRSSSIGSYKLCPTQYFIEYNLGWKGPSGKKAALGNIAHKALETLSWKSYHLARGNTSYDDETFGRLELDDVTTEWAVESAYEHYKREESHLEFKDRFDLRDCKLWVDKVMTEWGGYFNPANLKIVEAEKRFDIIIDEPWARYEYEIDGEKLVGQLGLKGTVDLVVEDKHDPNILEIADWKTGKRRDWATGAEKDYEYLHGDHQLLLYYYAFSKVYPGKQLIITIVFINEGGPYRLFFGPDDIPRAEAMLRKIFTTIRNDQNPRRINTWFCEKVCHFGRTKSDADPSRTICQYVSDTVSDIGLMPTIQKLGKPKAFLSYSDGGGRKNQE